MSALYTTMVYGSRIFTVFPAKVGDDYQVPVQPARFEIRAYWTQGKATEFTESGTEKTAAGTLFTLDNLAANIQVDDSIFLGRQTEESIDYTIGGRISLITAFTLTNGQVHHYEIEVAPSG